MWSLPFPKFLKRHWICWKKKNAVVLTRRGIITVVRIFLLITSCDKLRRHLQKEEKAQILSKLGNCLSLSQADVCSGCFHSLRVQSLSGLGRFWVVLTRTVWETRLEKQVLNLALKLHKSPQYRNSRFPTWGGKTTASMKANDVWSIFRLKATKCMLLKQQFLVKSLVKSLTENGRWTLY